MQGIKKTNRDRSVKGGGLALLKFYYILTPLFLVMERVWGINIRVPLILSSAKLRYAYYGVCFACGLLCYFKEILTPIVTIVESTINIALLCSGFFLTALTMSMEIGEGQINNVPEALSLKGVLGFVLALAVWAFAFKRSEWILLKGKRNL